MASGVHVGDDVLHAFTDIKYGHKHKYVMFGFNPQYSEIHALKAGDLSATYDQFVEDLPKTSGCYAVYDFDYNARDGGKRNKLVFVVWAPDSAKLKSKMLVASSKDALRSSLDGIHAEIQATDMEEIAYDEVLERVCRGDA
eukprot:comp16907_c0_seq1/m.15444 comp16907_c0_seq1/g.15444  ORF comp16907_c0_seq1/g.15444 comp16907_c0_seq1/m.15444 type:complete len:141 (-) comp16907_c0_seq1:13-435(-)